MKKKIALLLLLMLVSATVFAACSQSSAYTEIIPRWNGKIAEHYEFTVSLGDFSYTSEGNIATPHFRYYGSESDPYYKDFDVRSGEILDSLDEIRPTNVTGKFTLTISHPDDEYDLLETKQELELTYYNKDGNLINENILAELSQNNLVVSNSNGSITLKSTTETTVEFKHDSSQAPRKSSTKIVGFYLGKVHQEVSIYEISTQYTYEDNNTVIATALTENGETTTMENTLKRRSEGSFIDSNQLFTYARSLDKSSTSFQSSPSVSVYNPLTQEIQTATFSFNASANAILTDETRDEELRVKLPTLGVIVDGTAFMLQESVPNLKERFPDLFNKEGIGPDVTLFAGYPYAKHTTVRFRVGYISYELSHYPDEIWNALSTQPSNSEQ